MWVPNSFAGEKFSLKLARMGLSSRGPRLAAVLRPVLSVGVVSLLATSESGVGPLGAVQVPEAETPSATRRALAEAPF